MQEAKEPIALYGDNYTAKDYLSWSFDAMVEIIKGKVWKMSPAPRRTHQDILRNITSSITNFLIGNPCKVYFAPFDVYLSKDEDFKKGKTVVQPDLCIICDESKLHELGCIGAPDLIVEVLSPSTSKKDWNDKFNLYQEFGVKEYWIVSPEAKTIHVFTLEDGKYAEFGIHEKDAKFCGKLFPDMEIALEEVFKF